MSSTVTYAALFLWFNTFATVSRRLGLPVWMCLQCVKNWFQCSGVEVIASQWTFSFQTGENPSKMATNCTHAITWRALIGEKGPRANPFTFMAITRCWVQLFKHNDQCLGGKKTEEQVNISNQLKHKPKNYVRRVKRCAEFDSPMFVWVLSTYAGFLPQSKAYMIGGLIQKIYLRFF